MEEKKNILEIILEDYFYKNKYLKEENKKLEIKNKYLEEENEKLKIKYKKIQNTYEVDDIHIIQNNLIHEL